MAETETIAGVLKQHIADDDQSLHSLHLSTGVPYSSLHGFVNGERDMVLTVAQRLVDYFNLSLQPTPTRRPRKK